jgi:hypothetical protein
MTGSSAGKIECTATEGVTFFTFRVGVSAANTTATYSNIRIMEKPAEITSWDFSATQPVLRSANKNLLILDVATATKSGLTFTVNSDKSITINGTSTAAVTLKLSSLPINKLLEIGKTYTFKGTGHSGIQIGASEYTPAGAYVKTYTLKANSDNSFVYNGIEAIENVLTPIIYIPSGATINSFTVYPQLEKGSTATSFVKGDATGQVWISTGSSSPAQFNSLKKNNITLCPLSAKQYVGGAWVDKTAKSYQNGAWVDWWNPFYIFKSGEGAIAPLKHYTAGGVNATHTNSSIVHKRTGSAIRAVTVTQTAVALGGYSKLCARAKCTYANTEHVPVLGLLSTAPSSDQARPDIASVGVVANSTETVYNVPIPSGVSTAYIGYCGGSDIEIYDIWLE